ncbi:hypothetical protein HMPREF3229_00191 [Peptoniphilus harei]|uniref:Uncharacterized protein n=2 Tax=Peptoniphilus harei TaxID=54005 RepID=A0A133PS64_9FIRM|nr:hypothetical protein HMPREF3229_00191 [Peptoniphilus harei]
MNLRQMKKVLQRLNNRTKQIIKIFYLPLLYHKGEQIMKFKIEFTLDFKDQETLKMLLENHTIEELTQNGYCFAVDRILNSFNINGTQEVSNIKVSRITEDNKEIAVA